MTGKFVLKKSSDEKQFMFNLKAANGEIILTSELYKTKDSAEKGIESVRKNAPDDHAMNGVRPRTRPLTSCSRPAMGK